MISLVHLRIFLSLCRDQRTRGLVVLAHSLRVLILCRDQGARGVAVLARAHRLGAIVVAGARGVALLLVVAEQA